MHDLSLGLICGALVGMVLGVIGGGGSIFAVPLMVYLVGVRSPHVAIGTSAVAVAVSAAVNLLLHARRGTVKWSCAIVFSIAGVLGAWAGSSLGKATDGGRLLALFGVIMIVIGALTLRRRADSGRADVRLDKSTARTLGPRLLGTGLAAGTVAGFFGIGGGFLIVPSLIFATDMQMIAAVGSSLVGVTSFGLTTAANYARSGWVDWTLAGTFIAGGAIGGIAGTHLAMRLARRRRALVITFALVVIGVGAYMTLRGLPALGW
jgi:uncharacterized protein